MNESTYSWDVFISHASEDKPFADRLANLLKEMGLNVWYDSFILEIGDSLSKKLNEGLLKSNYGIVVMSRNFFAKDWTQLEVAALLNREIKNRKVILPIWHDISFEEVRELAPLLVDKVARMSEKDSLSKIAQDILKVIRPEKFKDEQTTKVFTLESINDNELVILPFRPFKGFTLAVSKYPVTNVQYRQYIEAQRKKLRDRFTQNPFAYFNNRSDAEKEVYINQEVPVPYGEHYKGGKWEGPFYPWEDQNYNVDDLPVVCVSAVDAYEYVLWLNHASRSRGMFFVLLKPELWNYAALGRFFESRNPIDWLTQTKSIHHNSPFPISIKNDGERINSRGISDMFGNIWEWCENKGVLQIRMPVLGDYSRAESRTELRGGGFLDDLGSVSPFLSSTMLKDGLNTKHSDLGFRIGAIIELSRLESEIREQLWLYKENADYLISEYLESHNNLYHFR